MARNSATAGTFRNYYLDYLENQRRCSPRQYETDGFSLLFFGHYFPLTGGQVSQISSPRDECCKLVAVMDALTHQQ